MTETRWWAPAGPHIGLDDADLAMLTADGSNPRLQLGAALIAAHRVGAAALEDAARTPLVDSRVVIAKLADARSRLGIPLSESVSKSVGDRRYAMVLVRDLLDDADMAAHDLFRAAVAKRVAPPVAAQRAAAVYGVDARGLGQYRALALDPRAHPSAVADAADRALFGYIEKIAEAEADDREEVSKAPAAERERPVTRTASRVTPDDPDTPYYDARDSRGQFAPTVGGPSMLARLRERYGIGGQTPPEVDTGRPSERAAEEQASPTRGKSMAEIRQEQQAKRRQRPKQRPRRDDKTIHDYALQRPGLQREGLQRDRLEQPKLKLTPLQREQLTRIAPKSSAHIAPPPPPRPVSNHPYLEHVSGGAHDYRHIPQDMLVHASEGQALEFLRKVASAPGRVGRIGHLLDIIGANTAEESGTDGAADQLTGFAHEADGYDPRTKFFSTEFLNKMDADEQKIYLAGEMQKMATRNGQVDLGRLEHISALPDTGDGGMVLVDETDTIGQGTPTVFEFVLEDAQGRVDRGEGTRQMQWKLDPDQAYRFAAPENWETTFDHQLRTIVHRVAVRAVDERGVHEYRTGVRKAEATVSRTQEGLATAPDGTRYYDVRDESGQFTASSSIAQRLKNREIVPPAAREQVQDRQAVEEPVQNASRPQSMAEIRAQRQQLRRNHQRRPQRPQRSPAQPQPLTPTPQPALGRGRLQRPGLSRQKLQQGQLARTVSEIVATRSKTNVLNDHADYAVLSGREAVYNFGIDPTSPQPGRHRIDTENAEYLNEIRTPGDEASGYIAEMATDPLDVYEVALVDYPRSDEDHAGIQAVIDDYLDRPDVGLVVATPVGDDLVSIQINRNPMKPVAIVELAPESYDVGTTRGNDLSSVHRAFNFEDLHMEFASRTTVQHDELLENGTVRSYLVPVVRYIATPGPNREGRR